MIFTCPGMAKPIEKRKNKTFPLIVIERAIANAAMLARRSVKKTDALDTNRLFRAGKKIRPASNNRLKLLKLHVSGRASGSEIIFRSDLNAPKTTIEHGTNMKILKIVSRSALIDL